MTIASLLNVPTNKQEWDLWSFSHKQHHDLIRDAIQSRSDGTVNLTQYQLDPVPADRVYDWQTNNQQSHNDFNQYLGLDGVDLEGADFTNPEQLSAWIYSNWFEHNNAAFILGI